MNMKMSCKFLAAAILAVVFVFGLTGSNAHAADAPDLGVAAGYSVFGNAGITETPARDSHLWGKAGSNGFVYANLIDSQVGVPPIDTGTNVPVANAISAAYGDLAGETQTGTVNLATTTTVGPGVYDVSAGNQFNKTLTLNGPGVYIFRSTSDPGIVQTAGGTMLLTHGACASDVFWQVAKDMTFAAPGNIQGTIIANTVISFVSGVNLKGRAWAGTQVTMDNNQITEPAACNATLRVIKEVDGGPATAADFQMHVTLGGDDVDGSPADGVADPGTTYTLAAGTYVVSEEAVSDYTPSFSDSCNSRGSVTLVAGQNYACTVTNTFGAQAVVVTEEEEQNDHLDIKVKKTASDYKLNSGPKKVTFTYKVTNEGDVALTDISVKDDECDDVNYVSGDDDDDDELDVNEEWKYTCKKTVKKTETNTVTAKGTANGERVKDTDTAKVTVSTPRLPSAGIGPEDQSGTPWNIIIPTEIFMASFSFYVAQKKLAIQSQR